MDCVKQMVRIFIIAFMPSWQDGYSAGIRNLDFCPMAEKFLSVWSKRIEMIRKDCYKVKLSPANGDAGGNECMDF